MKCPRCQHENPPQAKFCLECGARVALTCTKCRSELPAGAKFCLECGAPVASQATAEPARVTSPESYTPKHLAEKILTSKSALEGERKQVTVLFAASRARWNCSPIATPALAAKQATRTLPIVFFSVSDPVSSGLVTSLARPGGNVTGLSDLTPELVGKCLEQLKQAVPGVSRVAVFWQPGAFDERTEKDILKAAEVATRALGVRPQFVEARGPDDFDRAFSEMTRARAGALTVLPTAMFFNERRRVVDLAAKNRLPTVFPHKESVDAALWAMDRSLLICFGAPQPTWTRFSRV